MSGPRLRPQTKKPGRKGAEGIVLPGYSESKVDTPSVPFADLTEEALQALAAGRCVSIHGLSNSGKSTFMRGLASRQSQAVYARLRGRPVSLVYVDCNRAVALSAQAFYEVVLRSIHEGLGEVWSTDLAESMRARYQAMTEADGEFAASLSFNVALTELCERLQTDLGLLIDEFDEVYGALEERALLNLRALRDRFSDRLRFVTATMRDLRDLRLGQVESEFAELFSRSTFSMPLLNDREATTLLQALDLPAFGKERLGACLRLGGGHPGMLVETGQIAGCLPEHFDGDVRTVVRQAPGVQSECLKIWTELTEDERQGVMTLVLEAEAGLTHQQMRHLEGLGLVRRGEIFSPIFAEFVARRGRGAEVSTEGVYLDSDAGDVWVDGVRIPVLTDLEFRLLELLSERRDKLTDKYRIVTTVWGEDFLGEIDDARVEKLVSRLRAKIESDPAHPRYLVTQRGRGYKLLSQPLSE